jgi:hypothetical protein
VDAIRVGFKCFSLFIESFACFLLSFALVLMFINGKTIKTNALGMSLSGLSDPRNREIGLLR